MCNNRTKSNMKMSSFNVMTKKKSSFEKLLEIDSSVSIHDKNLRTLAIEMYKIYHGISPTMIIEIFTLRHQNQYILRNWTYFDVPKVKTVNHSSESVRYIDPKIWDIIPTHMKELHTIHKFKIAIKNGNQNLVHVDYIKSICKIWATYRPEHKFVALFPNIL